MLRAVAVGSPVTPARARDGFDTLSDLTEELYLGCPRCEGLAISRVLEATAGAGATQRRVVCTRCTFVRSGACEGPERVDPYFGLPLYLQADCRFGTVWACNPEHLAELRRWIEAPLRTRSRDEEGSWSNRSWRARLPAWMTRAGHRDEVLSAIARIEARLRRPGC